MWRWDEGASRGVRRLEGSAALLAMLLLLLPSRPTAHALTPETGGLQDCVATAIAHAGGRAGPQRTTFMLSGDSRVFSERLASDECVGLLVAGARQVQAIELVLQTAEGRTLARSAKPATWAYARHCGHAGEVVFATVRMLDGQGEVAYVSLARADAHPAALRALEQCPAVGTPRPSPLDVGPEPNGESIEAQLASAQAELSELGYGVARVVAYGTVQAGQHDASGLVLSADRCYTVVAAGSAGVLDLDLRVFGPTLPLSAAGVDVTRRRSARVKLCARAPARYVLDVAAFQGDGAYAVSVLELTEPVAVPGITGPARIAYAEVAARMQARGMHPRVVTSGIIAAEDQLAITLPFDAAACWAVAAVDTSSREPIALQLGLEGDDGELLATDARPGEPPLLFHCTTQPSQLRAVVRSSQARNDARFVLLLGSEASPR